MKIEMLQIDKVIPYARNPRKNDAAVSGVAASIQEFGFQNPIIIDKNDTVVAGHTRLQAARKLDLKTVPCVRAENLTDAQVKAFRLLDNKLAEKSEWNSELLSLEIADISALDFDMVKFDCDFSTDIEPPEVNTEDDEVPEAPKEAFSKLGDVWLCGKHRVMCGDSCNETHVKKVITAEITLLHADPPYGMGKEKEGILNDNLYCQKLDEFQMAWWNICKKHCKQNSSIYIWGNAEDLWRLWYVGGLKDSERKTFRNEIVWNKKAGQGILSESHRQYPCVTERCLFFMLGEQGFNNNADNYWEGWEPIRKYLEDERKKAGWDIPTMKRIVGHSDLSRDHWTSKSQWNFPTKEIYLKLQEAGKAHDVFKRDYDELKRDYDELKREFYSTRAYFDNTHDSMTDVWEEKRVLKEQDRNGHATPKPVEGIMRIVKTSSQKDESIFDPFLGSGTTLIAAHRLGRICYGMEIEPKYVDVICRRFYKETKIVPMRESDLVPFPVET